MASALQWWGVGLLVTGTLASGVDAFVAGSRAWRRAALFLWWAAAGLGSWSIARTVVAWSTGDRAAVSPVPLLLGIVVTAAAVLILRLHVRATDPRRRSTGPPSAQPRSARQRRGDPGHGKRRTRPDDLPN